jgi:arylformamidase
MPILDISVSLRAEMPSWPGSAGCTLSRVLDQGHGDDVTASVLHMDVHCGTHFDAPLHLIPSGGSVEEVDLESCIGPAYVADMRGIHEIGPAELRQQVPPDVRRLLLKTDNSALWERPQFVHDFAALTPDGAQWVADQGMCLVANDYLSVQLYGGDPRTHTILMGAGVVILEGVDLRNVTPGAYHLVSLPLRLSGAEGAPARAVLLPPDTDPR